MRRDPSSALYRGLAKFTSNSSGPFDADEAVQRTGAAGPNEVRGCRLVIPMRAAAFTESYGLSAETLLPGLKITAPIPIDEGLPDQRITLVLSHCITHPAVRRVGQIIELSKPANRPDRFWSAAEGRHSMEFRKTFGDSAWREVLDGLEAAYSEPIRLGKLLQPRDDGWVERRSCRDLAKIEGAALSYSDRSVCRHGGSVGPLDNMAAARQVPRDDQENAPEAGVLRTSAEHWIEVQ